TTKKPVSMQNGKPVKQEGFYLNEKKDQFISNFRDSFVFESGKIPTKWYMLTLTVIAGIIGFAVQVTTDKRIKKYFFLLLLAIPISFFVFLPLRGAIWPYYLIHLHFVYLYG